MRKNFSLIIAALLVVVNLVGCGTQKSSNSIKNSANSVKNKVENAPKQAQNDVMKIPKNLEADMGNGNFFISTSSGTSKNGSAPIIYTKNNSSSGTQNIQINTSSFNGNNMSYVFVDGILNTKKQLSNSKSNVDLKGTDLKEGKHRVDIVQFNGNNADGKVITHKSAYYEVRS